MRTILLTGAVLIGLAWTTDALADHDADVHLLAHAGTSYAIDTFLEALNEKAFHMNEHPVAAESFAAFTTLFIGAVYKASENASGSDMIKATWQNGLGVGASVLTRCMFHWSF